MVKIKEEIFWVGYVDWNLRNFHGYSTPSGSSYNAYLIIDEKPTLIDTVKYYGLSEMLRRIKELIDPAKIQYVVSNHTEMDHSGAIDALLELCPNAQVVCSPKGEEGLRRHFKKNWKFKVVNTSEGINIGKRNLKFFLMPMVHWPDSMATFCEQDKILFPNDAFGQHYASSERFVEEIGQDTVLEEAAKYYANIVMPYGAQVIKVLDALRALPIEMICPSHGLIWRRKDDIERILSYYKKWAEYQSDNRAVIVYDTMWHSTEKIAIKLYELIDKENIPVRLFNLQNTHISDIMTEVLRSRVILAGSPILNNKILPTMGAFLTYLGGLKPKNRLGLTFGSYGWSKAGFREFEEYLKGMGIELLSEGAYLNYVPDNRELEGLGEAVAKIKSQMR